MRERQAAILDVTYVKKQQMSNVFSRNVGMESNARWLATTKLSS